MTDACVYAREDALSRRMVAVLWKETNRGATEDGWVQARKLARYLHAPLADVLIVIKTSTRDDGVPYFPSGIWPDPTRGNRQSLWVNVIQSRPDEEDELLLADAGGDEGGADAAGGGDYVVAASGE